MSEVVLLGPDDHGLADRFAARGLAVDRIEGSPVKADLEARGVGEAAAFVLTDAGRASSIPVAHELNADLLVVLYTTDSLPAFAARQADLAVDPRLVDADELVAAVADRLDATA